MIRLYTRATTLLLLATSLLLMAACADAESEYDRMHSAAFFYRGVATRQALRSALEGAGVFCAIWCRNNVYHFENNYGATDTDNLLAVNDGKPYQAVEGFIVGKIAGVDMKGRQPIYAFDLACPNCDRELIRRALTLHQTTTLVSCSRCQRVYDLEKGGILVEGEKGIKLLQYHVSYDGMNTLQIYN